MYLFVRLRSTPGLGWMKGVRGAVWHWWDYMAVNVRLRKEEEEALHHKGNGNNSNGYRGREWRGEGKKGTRFVEQSLSW